MGKDKSSIAYISIVLTFLIFTVLFTFHLYNQDNIIKIDVFTLNNQPDNMHLRILNNVEKKIYIFKAIIYKEQFKKLNNDIYKVVLNGISAHWFKVYFNNTLLGTFGNFDNGYSNIQNAATLFDLDPSLIKEKNEIVIELSGTNLIGTSYPVLITNTRTAYLIETWFNTVLENINVITMGFLIFSIVLLFTLYKKGTGTIKRRTVYLYISLASIFLSFSLIRTLTLPYILIPGLMLRKICTSSIYISVYFLSMGLYKEYSCKINNFLSHLAMAGPVVILSFPGQYSIKIKIILLIIILLNIIGWMYSTAKNRKVSRFSNIFFWTSLFVFLTLIFIIVSIIYQSFLIKEVSYIVSFIFAISIIFYLIFEFTAIKDEISLQKKTAQLMYEKSIRDSMTGIYNYGYIAATLENTNKAYAVIIMDIDDFKNINDKYGHQVGDKVIKHVASSINKNTRKTDIVGRYGGDEFIIVLYDCNKKEVNIIAKKIKNAIEKPYKTPYGTIAINVSMGIYIAGIPETGNSSLLKADKALYYVKKHGKADIKIYHD